MWQLKDEKSTPPDDRTVAERLRPFHLKIGP